MDVQRDVFTKPMLKGTSNGVDVPGDGYHVVTIGPDLASHYLTKLFERQRNVNQGRVNSMVRDMRSGRWRFNPHPIVFDTDGRLIDGQHRLHAIAKSGMTFKMAVFVGADTEAYYVIDGDLVPKQTHNVVDNLTATHVAVARAMIIRAGGQSLKMTRAEELDMIDMNRVSIDFSINHIRGGDTTSLHRAPVRAAVARAHACGVDPTQLVEFGSILKSGLVPEMGAMAVITLRNWLLINSHATGGHAFRRETIGKVERAIQAFLNREVITKLYAPKDDIYPLPAHLLPSNL